MHNELTKMDLKKMQEELEYRRIELRVHRRRQQRPRARRQTRNARRKPPALQQRREGGCFRIAEQLSGLRDQEQNNTCFM